MLLALIGVIAGAVIGLYLPIEIPASFARYLSVAVLATLDSAFGGIRSSLEDKFDVTVFITGFFSNAVLAAAMTWLGDRIGVELYNAAVFAFGYRMFQNLGMSRSILLKGVRLPDEVELKVKR